MKKEHVLRSSKVMPQYGKTYPQISHGKGMYLYDINGKEYLDAVSGTAAVSNIGHGNKEVGEIISAQLKRFGNFPTYCFSSAEVEEYASELIKFSPGNFSKVWTCCSGTEAIENAIKLAIQYQYTKGNIQRYKIISRENSYHGNSIFALDLGGIKERKKIYSGLMHNFEHIPSRYCYRCPFKLNKTTCHSECAKALEDTILRENPENIAAVVLEPIVGAALGATEGSTEYFRMIRQICDKYDILLISDEVMTGFGRTGANFGIDNFDTIPDIIAGGKGIGGGYFPLSAIIAHHKVAEVLENKQSPFSSTHTFACNPIGAVVGKYILDFISKNELVSNSKKQGEALFSKLKTLEKYDIIGEIRGKGLMIGIEFVQDKPTKKPFDPSKQVSETIVENAFEEGLIIYKGKGSIDGINGDHIMLTPPLIISESEVDIIVHKLEKIIVEFMSKC